MTQPKVGIIMGSQSDWPTMKEAANILDALEVPYEKKIVSAHRTPDWMVDYAETAEGRGLEVVIAGAGGAAHLPGMVAGHTIVPVIGVPIKSRALNGMDSLLSIVQMPGGVPVATMAIGVTVFLLTFVLPRFAGVFEGKEEALPAPTKFLMSVSDFMVGYWWVLLLVAGGAIAGLLLFIKTELGGFWWDRFKLSMPVAKRMFRALYISRSLHTMGELVNAGVPMLDTLAITGDISGNRLFRRLWRNVYTSVKQGKKIAMPMNKSHLLPKAVVQMIAAGELGDVVFLELPESGSAVSEGDAVGTIETGKSVEDLYCPVSGEVAEVNDAVLVDVSKQVAVAVFRAAIHVPENADPLNLL